MSIVATQRTIECPFCPDEVRVKVIPENWSTTYAMAWFHTTHLIEHAEQMIACDRCVAAMWAPAAHAPCFDADCSCACSYTTTATERTADADG